jgi:hypothetical protein
MWVRDGATLRLVDCNLTDNNVVEGFSASGVIFIDGTFWTSLDPELAPEPRDTILSLDWCTFNDNDADKHGNPIAVFVDNVRVIPPTDTIRRMFIVMITLCFCILDRSMTRQGSSVHRSHYQQRLREGQP